MEVCVHRVSALSPYQHFLVINVLTKDEAPQCMMFADDKVLVEKNTAEKVRTLERVIGEKLIENK